MIQSRHVRFCVITNIGIKRSLGILTGQKHQTLSPELPTARFARDLIGNVAEKGSDGGIRDYLQMCAEGSLPFQPRALPGLSGSPPGSPELSQDHGVSAGIPFI